MTGATSPPAGGPALLVRRWDLAQARGGVEYLDDVRL
jgi:hypothetical protein